MLSVRSTRIYDHSNNWWVFTLSSKVNTYLPINIKRCAVFFLTHDTKLFPKLNPYLISQQGSEERNNPCCLL